MSGFEKSIDELGRVVIPMKFRKKLGLTSDSRVLVLLNDNSINITPLKRVCALCENEISTEQKFRLCKSCIKKIKESNL